jgi:hypothetical protein
MQENYCQSCYRTLPYGKTTCSSCNRGVGPGGARLAVITGAVGLTLLVAGMLTLNVRLCLTAASISAFSAIAYVWIIVAQHR